MRIEWKDKAKADAHAILRWIAQDNIGAAYRIFHEIERQVEQLLDFPEIGRKGRLHGTRELVISGTPYLAIYRIRKETVHILRVLHAARRWPPSLPKD